VGDCPHRFTVLKFTCEELLHISSGVGDIRRKGGYGR
jgi:hypothetical protein